MSIVIPTIQVDSSATMPAWMLVVIIVLAVLIVSGIAYALLRKSK